MSYSLFSSGFIYSNSEIFTPELDDGFPMEFEW